MAKKQSTELAKTQEAPLAQVPDYGSYSGQGYDNTRQDDFTIPFLTVLQALSPQVQAADAAYIEGAKPGSLLLTSTGELFAGDEGVEIIPCITEHLFVEWVPRKAGGGFVAIHACDSPVVAAAKAASTKFGKYKNGENDLVETYYIYCLVVRGDDVISPCMIAFTSTKIKQYKSIMTKLRTVKAGPPLFANRVRVTTCSQKNAEGTFFNFVLEPANGDVLSSLIDPQNPLVAAGAEMRKQVLGGLAKIDHSGQSATDGEEAAPDTSTKLF